MPSPSRYLSALPESASARTHDAPYYLLMAACCILLLQIDSLAHAQSNRQLTFDQDTRVWVEGTSTIHDWSCEAGTLSGRLEIADDAEPPLTHIQSTSLDLPVAQLECGKDKMNRKLREAFQADDHPDITFEATRIETREASPGSGPAFPLLVEGKLTMAGTTNTIEVTAKGYEESEGRYKFTGQHELDMTEYGMEPPTAVWGTIKTGEKVTVHFEVWAAQQ